MGSEAAQRTEVRLADLPESLTRRIRLHKTRGCWRWNGAINSEGYAVLIPVPNARRLMAYRYIYETYVGPVPDGLELDHLCRVRHCVNPAHLEPVTHQVNVLRGNSPAAKRARQTECTWGHPFAGDNLGITLRGTRVCRTCEAALARRRATKRLAEKEAKTSGV